MIKARKACSVMQDYLLNCWEETPFVVPIANEEIVAVSWLQSSGMVFIYLLFLHISAFDAFGCFVVIYILCTVKTIANKNQDAVARLTLTSNEKDDYVSIIHS